ncbi:MAG TPA: hypothetical protein PKM58_05790 [Pyrinomonadaceae bacterium]|nr:hypothetical protein [Pyrinomonadaceae bacterium]
MTRIFLVLLISAFVLSLTACSVRYDFMIVNETDAPLEIGLKWNDVLKVPLRTYSYLSFDGKKFEQLELIHTSDVGEKQEIRVVLEPKQALSVHSIDEWPREAIRRMVDSEYRIYQIDLKGSKGEIHLSGEQTWNQFREMDGGYFLIYR